MRSFKWFGLTYTLKSYLSITTTIAQKSYQQWLIFINYPNQNCVESFRESQECERVSEKKKVVQGRRIIPDEQARRRKK